LAACRVVLAPSAALQILPKPYLGAMTSMNISLPESLKRFVDTLEAAYRGRDDAANLNY
jgi:hypothetical protein